MSPVICYEDVEVGQELPVFVRSTGLMNWNRFAAVNDEFIAIHMDSEAARRRGDKGALGMGSLRFSYLHSLVRHWIGETGEIRQLRCDYKGINYEGDQLTCGGHVTAKREGQLAAVALWVRNQDGVTLDTGEAVVALPLRSDPNRGMAAI